MTVRDKFRAEVAECLTNWRLGTIPPRSSSVELEILRSGISEILQLRLVALCLPLFETMRQIDERLKCLK